MQEAEILELRRDIKDLSVNVAKLTQKIEDLEIPKQPCGFFKDHINKYHTNTLLEKIKDRAIATITTAIILAVGGYILYGFQMEIIQKKIAEETKQAGSKK